LVVEAYENLNRHLGIQAETRVFSKWLHIATEQILKRFGIDTRSLSQGNPDQWRDISFADGSYQDEWGVVRSKPKDSLYYDLTRAPFQGEPTMTDLEQFAWPDPHDPGRCRGLAEEAKRLHGDTDHAIVLNMPGGIVHQSQFMRGFEGWFTDLILNPSFFNALLEKICDLWIEMARDEFDAARDHFDLCFYGDDMAFQNGPMMSMDLYRKMIVPHQSAFLHISTHSPRPHYTCGRTPHPRSGSTG
jgi:uroporphyrinogen decarboxylase